MPSVRQESAELFAALNSRLAKIGHVASGRPCYRVLSPGLNPHRAQAKPEGAVRHFGPQLPFCLGSSLAPAGTVWAKARPSEDCEEAVSDIAQQEIDPTSSQPLDLPPDAQPAPKWFAVYTNSRHEKRVGQHLSMREIEHYLPLYHVQRKWSNGLRVTLDLPLFPGYIFVRIHRAQRVRVLEVPGVLALVGGTGGEPAPLPEADIEALRSGLSLRRVEPHPLLKVGQRARIRSGAFAGMEGIVVRKKNSFRVVLTLDTIMQSFAVEVDGKELEPLDSGGLNRA